MLQGAARGQVGFASLVDHALRYVAALDQGFRPPQLRLGEFGGGPCDLDLGLGLLQPGLEDPGIDGEKQVAALDQGAVDEVDLIEIAADPRPHLDLVGRLETADELVVLDDFLDDGLGHGDRGRGLVLGGDPRRNEAHRQNQKNLRAWAQLRCAESAS